MTAAPANSLGDPGQRHRLSRAQPLLRPGPLAPSGAPPRSPQPVPTTIPTLYALGSQLYPGLTSSPAVIPPTPTPPSFCHFPPTVAFNGHSRGPKPITPIPVPRYTLQNGTPSHWAGRGRKLKCRWAGSLVLTCCWLHVCSAHWLGTLPAGQPSS